MVVTKVKAKKAKSAAPGQYLGYGLQDVRLCHHLLTMPTDCVVSLELIDDTAIHYQSGQVVLEQVKSALSSNPISDSSVELWKCFANWARLCVECVVDPNTTQFRLYACPPKEGDLVRRLHAASTNGQAEALLTEISNEITLKKELKGCGPMILSFLTAGPDLCKRIILNFQLSMEADPLQPIREKLRYSVFENSLDDFCAHAIGMAKNSISELIRAKEMPIINAGDFQKRLQAFTRKHGALGLLVPTAEQPTETEIEEMLAAAPLFVQQLLRVNMGQEHIVRAVSDYLRSDADRILWAAEGRIVEESLEELHDTLEAYFQITRDEIEDLHSAHNAEARGRQLYRRCVSHSAPLEGRPVPGYFIPGTYNLLADKVRVGWHPQYSNFFRGE